MATEEQWERDVMALIKESPSRVTERAPWLVYVSPSFAPQHRAELGRGLVVCSEVGVVVPLLLLGDATGLVPEMPPLRDASLYAVDEGSAMTLARRFMGNEEADRCFQKALGDRLQVVGRGLRFFPYVVFDGQIVRVGSFVEVGAPSTSHASAPS